MGLYDITVDKVKNLLRLLRGGLEDTAGKMEGQATFCVQQAVTRSIHGKDNDEMSDQPHCVGPSLTNFGINLNDSDWWDDDEDRARGLKEFAVAELGSNTINQIRFENLLTKKFHNKYPVEGGAFDDFDSLIGDCQNKQQFLDLISMSVEVLQEMKSPGCEYLHLCHPRKYSHLKPVIPTATSVEMQGWASRQYETQNKTSKSIHDLAN